MTQDIIRFTTGPSPLGNLLIAQTDNGICALLIEPEEGDLQPYFPKAALVEDKTALEKAWQAVIIWLENPAQEFTYPLDIRGTAFQKNVWNALLQIPYGQTSTYSAIARKIGSPKAVRAVGTACGDNKISLIIPCHRVLSSSGKLSGYRWGLQHKEALLKAEQSA